MLEFIRAVLQVPEVGMRNPGSGGVAASRISLHWRNVGDGDPRFHKQILSVFDSNQAHRQNLVAKPANLHN